MGMMDKIFAKITGGDADKKTEASGIRKKEDLGTQETVMSPGIEKQWNSKMAQQEQSAADQKKLDELRQDMASQSMIDERVYGFGGPEAYMQEVRESTEAFRKKYLQEQAEKEKLRIEGQNKLKALSTVNPEELIKVRKDLELWEQREAEEKARRERLDLE